MTVQLTKRQSLIASLVAAGYSNQAMAIRLGLSVHTIDAHLRDIASRIPCDPERSRRDRIAQWWRDQAA